MNLRILPVVLTLLLAGSACTERTKSSDFNVLAARAYPEGGAAPNREALDDLWSSLFQLPQWHFLMTSTSAEKNQPGVVTVSGQGWILGFTDLDKLKRYAMTQSTFGDGGVSFLGAGDGGTPLVLSMTPEAATNLIATWANPAATGIRFNEGATGGWFAPLKVIPDIRGHLKQEGKLYAPK